MFNMHQFTDELNNCFNVVQVFYPEELEQVFCGSSAATHWDIKVRRAHIRCFNITL